MSALQSSGIALLVGLVVVIVWHLRRKARGWPRRKPDYVWAFIEGGVIYVLVVVLISHHYSHVPYSKILDNGFGEAQVNVAFIAALWEAIWHLWDMWNGHQLAPSPDA